MGFPSDKVVANGARLFLQLIPAGGSAPDSYVITATAAAAIGATSIQLQSDEDVFLSHEEELKFPGGTAIVNLPELSTLNDVIQVPAGSAVAVPVQPLTGAIASGATANTYAMLQLLGITDCSPPMAVQVVDTTDMRSGFGQSQVAVGVDRTVQVTGYHVSGDRCKAEILYPYLTDNQTIRQLLYVVLEMPNGDRFEGTARVTDSGATAQVRNVLGYNFTFGFEGETFQFTNGDAGIFALSPKPITP